LAVYLHKKLQLRMGWTSSLANTLILAVGAYFFGLEPADGDALTRFEDVGFARQGPADVGG